MKHAQRTGAPVPVGNEWSRHFENGAGACLNCGHKVADHYCGHCGQRLHTHRLSISHFIAHDLVHGLFHVDRGIFHTLLEVTARPGYAALDYIRGKRTGKFPIVTLLVLLIATLLLLWKLNPQNTVDAYENIRRGFEQGYKQETPRSMIGMAEFVGHHSKWFLLALIPLNAVLTWAVFRRLRLNWAEHLLLNSYFFAGALVLAILYNLGLLLFHQPFDSGNGLLGWIGAAFYVFAYWQAFGRAYTVAGFLWRVAAQWALAVAVSTVAVVVAMFAAVG